MKNLKVGYLITARLKSERLKNKLLLKVKDKPIISHLIDRIKLSKRTNEIIICTSNDLNDRPLIKIAKENKIKYFIGNKNDVLKRLHDAAVFFELDYILNVTADCPFADPYYADLIVKNYEKSKPDLIRQFDLPHGAFSYGISPHALKKVIHLKSSINTEVWGNYFVNTGLFKVVDLPVINKKHRRPDIRMTLDYPEDYQFFREIFKYLYKKNKIFSLTEIIDLLNQKPHIQEINDNCKYKFTKRFSGQSDISLKKIDNVDSALIVGCGSIGKRHLGNLKKLKINKLYAKRTRKGYTQNLPKKLKVNEFATWKQALAQNYDIAIISNPSSLHLETIRKVIKNVNGIFIEKPLSHNLYGCNNVFKLLKKSKVVSFVGNNLLFHPIVNKINSFISNNDLGQLINMQIQAGQYLPDWHPYENFKNSYFSRKDLGGGVLLTLIHEIQLAINYAGKPSEVLCFLQHNYFKGIDVEVAADLSIKHKNNSISQIHIDYLQKESHRSGILTFENGWISYDFNLLQVEACIKGKKKKLIWKDKSYDYNKMYIKELEEFIKLTEERQILHNYDVFSALDSIKVVDAAKKSYKKKSIIKIKEDKENNFFR